MEPLTNCYPYISPIFELAVISNESLVRQPKHKQRQRSPPAQSEDLPLEVWLAELRGGLLRLTNSHQFTPPATAHPG